MRPAERTQHTRFGWWLMTHDRSAAALIGGVAFVLLVADLAYVASRWNGLSGRFDRGFLLGLVALLLVVLLLRPLGVGQPIGSDRLGAGRRARRVNAVSVLVIGLLVVLTGWSGGHTWAGTILGMLAVLWGFFAALSAWWGVKPRTTRRGA